MVPFSPALLIHTKPFGSLFPGWMNQKKSTEVRSLYLPFHSRSQSICIRHQGCEERMAWHQVWKNSKQSEFPGSEDRTNYCAEKRGVSEGFSPSPPGSVTMGRSSHHRGLSFFICIQIYGVTQHPQIHPKPPGCLWTLALETCG